MAEGEHGGVKREHYLSMREQGRAAREHGEAEGEHIDETVVSGRAKRRHLSQRPITCWPGFGDTIHIYVFCSFSFFCFSINIISSRKVNTNVLIQL